MAALSLGVDTFCLFEILARVSPVSVLGLFARPCESVGTFSKAVLSVGTAHGVEKPPDGRRCATKSVVFSFFFRVTLVAKRFVFRAESNSTGWQGNSESSVAQEAHHAATARGLCISLALEMRVTTVHPAIFLCKH